MSRLKSHESRSSGGECYCWSVVVLPILKDHNGPLQEVFLRILKNFSQLTILTIPIDSFILTKDLTELIDVMNNLLAKS